MNFDFKNSKKFTITEQTQIAHIILKTVEELHCGRERLALFLKGSRSRELRKDDLNQKKGFGALYWYEIPTIKGFILQLEEMEFIKTSIIKASSYSYPIIKISDAGKVVLNMKIDVPLLIKKIVKPIKIGESETETFVLFKKGLKPDEIASKRGLSISTIFGHIHKLIAVGSISANQCISADVIRKVLKAKIKVTNSDSVKELKQILPEEITYEEIRAVILDKRLNEAK